MLGKPVKLDYLHVKRILQCTKMQELIYCKRYKFTNEHDLLDANNFSFVQGVFEYECKLYYLD